MFLILALAMFVGVGSLRHDHRRQVASEQVRRQRWHEDLLGAFRPMADELSALIRKGAEWRTGDYPAADLAAELEAALPKFVRSRDQVAALPELESAPGARALYLQAARLHLEFVRVYLAAVRPPLDALKSELHLLGSRLRVLADRVYDQAGAIARPVMPSAPTPAIEFRMVEEVPRWESEGLAPGPPLATLPVRKIRDAVKPPAVVQLGLFVDAEAARVAQAAELAVDESVKGSLRTVVRRLTLIGDRLS